MRASGLFGEEHRVYRLDEYRVVFLRLASDPQASKIDAQWLKVCHVQSEPVPAMLNNVVSGSITLGARLFQKRYRVDCRGIPI